MTVGEFRTLTGDLPDSQRVTLAIGQDIVPSWIKSLKLSVERGDWESFDTVTGKRTVHHKVLLNIDLDDPPEENWAPDEDG